MPVELVLLFLAVGAMQARSAWEEAVFSRWVLCGLVAVAMIFQVIYGLVLLAGITDWSRQMTRLLSDGGALEVLTFIWMIVAVWVILILGLVAALKERGIAGVSNAGQIMMHMMVWSIAGLALLAFLIQLTRETSGLGSQVLMLVVSLIAVLGPFLAGAYLSAGAFQWVLLGLVRAVEERKKRSEAPELEVKSSGHPVVMPAAQLPSEKRQAQAMPAKGGSEDIDIAEALKKLKRLKEEGLITDAEFDAKKKQMLDKI